MTAILKREFRDYFNGMFGWIFVAVLVLAGGAMVAVTNLLGASSEFSYIFSALPEVLLVLFPLTAARAFPKEYSKGNALWLGSLPVGRTGLVLGKYFAALALFLITTALLALFPPLLANFGAVSYGNAYTALFGYFLMGAALLAVCTFFASLMRTRIAAVVVNLLICLWIYFSSIPAVLFAAIPWLACLICVVCAAALGVFVGLRRKKTLAGLLTGGIPILILVLLYFLVPAFYERFLPDAINLLSVYNRLSGFRVGHFDFPAAVFYLSVTVLFLFLTVQLSPRFSRKEEKAE